MSKPPPAQPRPGSSSPRALSWLARLPTSVVAAGLTVRLIDEWWSYLPAGIVDDLHRDLAVSYAGAGWLLALMAVGGLAASPFGLLADHVDRRRTAVAGSTLLTGALVVYALGAPFPLLAAASVVLGAASDLMIGPIEAALADVAGDDLDRLLGRQHAWTFVGDLLGPGLLVVGATTALGWRGAFALTALALLAFTIFLAFTDFPPPTDAADGAGDALRDALSIARRRDVWRLAGVEMLLGPLDEPLLAVVIARTAATGVGAGLAQLLAGAIVIGGLAGSLAVARWGVSRRARQLGPTLLAGGAAIATLDVGLVADAMAMAAVGVGMGLVWAALHHRLLTVVPGRSATVSTIVGVAGTVTALAAPALGAVADRWNLTTAVAGYAILACLIVVLAPSALRPSASVVPKRS